MKLSPSHLLLAATWLGVVSAFCPLVGISTTVPTHRRLASTTSSVLFAQAGAPQYQTHKAVLERVETVGKGSYLLHVFVKYNDSVDLDQEAESAIHYQPGHVLALEIQPAANESVSANNIAEYASMNEKTQKDLENNQGWLRGPYTVTRGLPSNNNNNNSNKDGFQVLVKQVGYKSNVMATAAPNSPVRFGGKFKVPIVDGILNNIHLEDDGTAHDTERVVLVSTGVGVGPCVGAIERLLNDKDASFQGKIVLLSSFRTTEEVAMANDLEKLMVAYPERFKWKPIITSESGRLSKSTESLQALLVSKDDTVCSVQNTHYHLIGNGQLVNEWKAGLERAGVPKERVTLEAYFNHSTKPDASAVENIASTVKKLKAKEAQVAR